MRHIKLIGLLFIVLLIQACPESSKDPDMQFTIKNESTENIYFYANTSDATVMSKDIGKGYGYLIPIKIGDFYNIPFWINLFNQSKKLNILIYKQSTLDMHSWEDIQKNDIFDKRYVLTLEELKSMNYTVMYKE